MTLEDILNIDWAEQKDLSEYVKYFEDQQALKQQLAYFTYQFLRSKLISWREITEEGLENFNFFNLGCKRLNYGGKYYYMIVPVGKRFIPHLSLYEMEDRTAYSPRKEYDLDSLLNTTYKYFKGVLGQDAYDEQYIEALFLFTAMGYSFDDDVYSRNRFSYFSRAELLKRSIQNPYIEIIERGSKEEWLESYGSDYYSILQNKEVIRLGLLQKFDEVRRFRMGLETLNERNKEDYYCYGNLKRNYRKTINPEALYYINELGQPIYLTLESKFDFNYISTEVDIKKNQVTFSFRGGGYYGEVDNSVVYQYNWGCRYDSRIKQVTADLNEDKIIEL